jgi:hypothetical protein
MGTIRSFFNWFWKEYRIVVLFFIVDNESGLRNDWDDLIAEEGIRVFYSPPETYGPNRSIKRTG